MKARIERGATQTRAADPRMSAGDQQVERPPELAPGPASTPMPGYVP